MTGADGCALLATGPRAMAEAAGPDMGLEADDPAMAAKLQLTRAVIDPLHERFVELADEHKVLHKKDLVTAIPALAASPFYTAVFGLLRNGAPSGNSRRTFRMCMATLFGAAKAPRLHSTVHLGAGAVAEEGGLSASQTVAEEAFIAALAKFDHSAPLVSPATLPAGNIPPTAAPRRGTHTRLGE